MAIRVIKPGMLTTVQDRGRWGYQSRGVSVAGPMDPFAHRVANALVGHVTDEATLEVTLVGPELEFEDDRVVAVAGAAFELSVDGVAVDGERAFGVRSGSTLRFGPRRRGARAYVAISGGIATPPVLGSRATHVTSGIGGLEGRLLKAGDRVPLGRASTSPARGVDRRSGWSLLPGDGQGTVRVLPGSQSDCFSTDALEALQSSPYRIAPASDRMGFRLEGPPLSHAAGAAGADIISDATPLGAVQVPASQQPILLMADRQTTGGYPKIAVVIAADIGLAGQLGPGDAISFVVCSREEALSALVARERALQALEAAGR